MILSPPAVSEGNLLALDPESTLDDLRLYSFQVELDCPSKNVAHTFEQYPLLPGVILTRGGQFVGMLSRKRLLEYLIRPHGLEWFFAEPLGVLYSYARTEPLVMGGNTLILNATQQALRRPPELQAEPIVVQVQPDQYCLLDIHELYVTYWQLRGIETQVRYERTQAQLIQSDKMAALGRLVDGVAHEILDPVSFIWGNLSHVAAYSESLLEVLTAYEKLVPNPPDSLVRLQEQLEFDYLRQDFPQALDSIRTGADRLCTLVSSLQNFCHIDDIHPKPTDLHACIDGLLLLLKSRLTTEISVERHYGNLPPVPCYAGQLGQVLMNILNQAIDALLNQAVEQQLSLELGLNGHHVNLTEPAKPHITITTQVRSLNQSASGGKSRWVSICIADNGPGLSPSARQQILDSFSVKKRAAKETSLAISYQIVTAKHGGQLKLRSRNLLDGETGGDPIATPTGTEFEILLPLV